MPTPTLVKIVGILFVLMAILFLITPQLMRKTYKFFIKGKRIYLAGVLRLILGVIFLLAAAQCKNPAVIMAIGVLFIIAGIMVFTIKLDKLLSIVESFQNKSSIILRLIALVPLAVGLIVVYCA